MWLAKRKSVSATSAWSWYTHVMAEKVKRRLRQRHRRHGGWWRCCVFAGHSVQQRGDRGPNRPTKTTSGW